MKHSIYVHTGTGNSLAVARQLAQPLGTDVHRLRRPLTPLSVDAGQSIGIVFPVYHGTVPRIVRQWCEGLNAVGAYVWAACTYGDTSGAALADLATLLTDRGIVLAAGWALRMPYNYVTPPKQLRGFFSLFSLRQIPAAERQAMVTDANERVQEIAQAVLDQARHPVETYVDPIHRFLDRLGFSERLSKSMWLRIGGVEPDRVASFWEGIPLMDAAFWADENCVGCGVCTQVCPVGDIALVDGTPTWHGDCEQCMACLQWCPQGAIQFRGGTQGSARYHHPDISLRDLIDSDELAC